GHLTFRINGQDKVLFRFGRYITGGAIAQADMELEIDLDLTTYNMQQSLTLEVLGYVSGPAPSKTCEVYGIALYKQDDIPIVARDPSFARQYSQCDYSCQAACEGTCQSACQNVCQSSCQQSCQSACQTGCQDSCMVTCESDCRYECQTGCQMACRSACESSSQGGGGCLRAGTPVTIWDEEAQEYRDIPVEELQVGMIMPKYDPHSDSIIHGRLTELQDAGVSSAYLRIHTNGGPSVDVTYEQPFDVLVDTPDGPRWYRLQAKYLKPGMKMVRPFDKPENRLVTITDVQLVKTRAVRFYNPRTDVGGYIAAGYGDLETKMPY